MVMVDRLLAVGILRHEMKKGGKGLKRGGVYTPTVFAEQAYIHALLVLGTLTVI